MTENGHSKRRAVAVAIISAALVAGVLALPVAAAHRRNHTDPCADARDASRFLADYDKARKVHQPSIDCALYRAITNGAGTNSDGERVYRPAAKVTRAQMAQFVVNTLVSGGHDAALPSGEGADRFDDIAGNFARVAINRLADAGIVSGTDENSYSPDDVIRRQQMASFLVQAANWAANPDIRGDDINRFSDVSEDNPHRANIENGADAGLFQGTSETTFHPRRVVVRDQMATFLVSLLRHIFDQSKAPEPYQARVEIDDTNVEAGSDVTGQITGSNITGASIKGCGIGGRTLTDNDEYASGIQYASRIPPDTPAGECTLTFTITFNDDRQAAPTVTINVTRPKEAARR